MIKCQDYIRTEFMKYGDDMPIYYSVVPYSAVNAGYHCQPMDSLQASEFGDFSGTFHNIMKWFGRFSGRLKAEVVGKFKNPRQEMMKFFKKLNCFCTQLLDKYARNSQLYANLEKIVFEDGFVKKDLKKVLEIYDNHKKLLEKETEIEFKHPREGTCGLWEVDFKTIKSEFDILLNELKDGLDSYSHRQEMEDFISYFENIIHHVEFIHEFMYLESIQLLKEDSVIASDSQKGIKIIDDLVTSYKSLIPNIANLKQKRDELKPLIFHAQNFSIPIPVQYTHTPLSPAHYVP